MAKALLGGLIECDWAQETELHVVEPLTQRRKVLAEQHPNISVDTKPLKGVDAVLAVKPDVVASVLPALADVQVRRVLSIAAGVPTETIENQLPAGVAVVRAMPNTCALVGQGAAAAAKGAAAGTADLDWAAGILGAVGTVEVVDETDLDAVTGLSGSGPAYVFLLAEALTAAGVAQGLTPQVADSLTRQTLLGAATLLTDSEADPALLRANVTSPGGTTEAGLAVFNEADFAGVVAAAVQVATERSRELGTPAGINTTSATAAQATTAKSLELGI